MYKSGLANIFLKPTETRFISQNVNMDIVIIICIILFLVFIYFITLKNTFIEREKAFNQEQNKLLKNKNFDLKPLKCDRNTDEYRLVDYYIASSYNTASLGRKHLDYVSLDAVRNTLLQGARYIQLNLCSNDLDVNNVNDEPVIGTCLEGKYHITSLNTIPFKSVVKIIKEYLFKVLHARYSIDKKYRSIDYPLIIDLGINTKNIHVLDKAYDYIKEELGSYLLNKSNYTNFPIQYEKLCNLKSKIILWSDGTDISKSKLDDIIIPKNLLIQKLNISKISSSILDESELQYYLDTISKINVSEIYKQKDIFKIFVDKVKNSDTNYLNDKDKINKLINIEYNEFGIMNKMDLETKLVFFNTIGMTIITPDENNMFIDNYDLRLPFETGCQINAIAYQDIDDINYKKYKNIFKNTSFVLKPGNIRLPKEEETEELDLLEKYELAKQKFNNFDYQQEYYRDNFNLLYLQEIISGDYKYATIMNKSKSLQFRKMDQLTDRNYLLTKRVDIDGINAVMLLNPLNKNECLTIKDNYKSSTDDNLYFTTIYNNSSNNSSANNTKVDNIKKQLFVLEKPLKEGNDYSLGSELYVSIRSIMNTDEPYYLSVYKNNMVLRQKRNNNNYMTFNSGIRKPVFTTTIRSVLFDKFLKVFTTGLVGLSNNKSKFELMYNDKFENEDRINIYLKYNDKFICMNKDKELYLSNQQKCSFELENKGLDYLIKKNGEYLSVEKDGTLVFKEDQPLISKQIRDDLNRVIQQERRGPKLGSSILFSLESDLKL